MIFWRINIITKKAFPKSMLWSTSNCMESRNNIIIAYIYYFHTLSRCLVFSRICKDNISVLYEIRIIFSLTPLDVWNIILCSIQQGTIFN